MVGSEDGLAINGNAGGNKGHGARGDDDILGGDCSANVDAAWQAVLDSIGIDKLALTDENLDSKGFEGTTKVALDSVSKVGGVAGDLFAFEADVVDLDAESFQMMFVAELADFASGSEECLGRDAATVDAGTTNIMTFDDGDLETL